MVCHNLHQSKRTQAETYNLQTTGTIFLDVSHDPFFVLISHLDTWELHLINDQIKADNLINFNQMSAKILLSNVKATNTNKRCITLSSYFMLIIKVLDSIFKTFKLMSKVISKFLRWNIVTIILLSSINWNSSPKLPLLFAC